MAQVQVLKPGDVRTRKNRRPVFPIAGTMKPYGLYPIMVHPVLPGETLQAASCKWRVVSAPVVHPLAGAWLESWFFYVKFTDIDRELGNMFVSDSFSSSGYTASGDVEQYFVKSGQIDWVRLCTQRVWEAFFADDSETFADGNYAIDNVRQIKLNAKSWMNNLMFKPADTALVTSDVGDQQEQLTAYQMMQLMSMQELTYEQYLSQYGVQSVRTSIGDPEILRFARSWVQPVNTINPSDGSPSSAWYWNDEIDMSKPKRFDEPGFIVQMAAIRPKMFYKYLASSMVGNLWGFSDWFPIYNVDDPNAGVRELATDDDVFDPLANGAESSDVLWYDHNDVLNHGEQFINDRTNLPFALPEATAPNLLAASDPQQMRGEYCTEADVEALFVGETEATQRCYYEGMTSLTITGHTKDLIR
jgi:hypothetical protein